MNLKPTLCLTPALFYSSIQSIVLAHRHGRMDEAEANHRTDRNNAYQATEAQLRHRELSHCEITLETNSLLVHLALKRCYHHEGRLCRVHYVAESGSELRRKGLKDSEVNLAQIAAWAAGRYFSTPPNGIRLIYHVLPADDSELAILESWTVDQPLLPRAEVEALVAARLAALEAAFKLPDDRLPECDMDERHGTDGNPYKKCFDFCRARKQCCEFQRYLGKRAGGVPNFTEY